MTTCSLTIWNHDGTEQRNLGPMLKVTAIAVPPQSHYHSLGAWQSVCTYHWLSSTLRSCDCHLQSSLWASPENKSRSQCGRSLPLAERTPSGFLGLAEKGPFWNPNRILAWSVFSMEHLSPASRRQREFCYLWELDANTLICPVSKFCLDFRINFSASVFESERGPCERVSALCKAESL